LLLKPQSRSRHWSWQAVQSWTPAIAEKGRCVHRQEWFVTVSSTMPATRVDPAASMGGISDAGRLPSAASNRRADDRQNQLSNESSRAGKNRHTMTFHISGIGTAVPRELITQDDAARLAIELAGQVECHAAAIQTLYRKRGPQASQHAHHLVDQRTTGDANILSHCGRRWRSWSYDRRSNASL